MSSYKGLGPKKQFWPTRMKLSKPFNSQLFHYAENLLYELISNIHRINCPTPIGHTKIRPLTCCVISLAQYILKYTMHNLFSSFLCFASLFAHFSSIHVFNNFSCNDENWILGK